MAESVFREGNLEFTLFYKGSLRSNGDSRHKEEIRAQLHGQLRVLWTQPPLNAVDEEEDNAMRVVGGISFVPLVSANLEAHAALSITLLRPGPPGRLVQGGDIDNRLKTLFDALTIPQQQAIPPGTRGPPDGGRYYYCLLEDDKLITQLCVSTDRFLAENLNSNDVLLLAKVKTIPRVGAVGAISGLLE